MGHDSFPGVSTSETRKSSGIDFATPAAAAEVASRVGATKCPSLFRSDATFILFCLAYASSTYPMAPGVCFTTPATPSFPFPPIPTGQLTDGPRPTFARHSVFTVVR